MKTSKVDYKYPKIQIIGSGYVKGDCAQYMVAHRSPYLAVIGDEVIYSALKPGEETVHAYVKDSRRLVFPYADIPTHRQWGNNVLLNYTNQIYEYDKPYIVLRDNIVSKQFVTKTSDGRRAIIIDRKLDPIFRGYEGRDTREEFAKMLEEKYIQKGKNFIFSNGGHLLSEEDFLNDFCNNDYTIVTIKDSKRTITRLNISITDKNDYHYLYGFDYSASYAASDSNSKNIKSLEGLAQPIPETKIPWIYNRSISRETVGQAKTMARMKNGN